MYERFTDRARKVMQLANQEAQRFNHEYIGTEHILLGLIHEGEGVAAGWMGRGNAGQGRRIRGVWYKAASDVPSSGEYRGGEASRNQ